MSYPNQIGPSIPNHLLHKDEVESSNSSLTPCENFNVQNKFDADISQLPLNQYQDLSDTNDNQFGPLLPPGFKKKKKVIKVDEESKKVKGPEIPDHLKKKFSEEVDDDEEDDIFGPILPKNYSKEQAEIDAYQQKLNKIEDRIANKKTENGGSENLKKLKRGEWMLAPPEIATMPKLGDTRSRQFQRHAKEIITDRSDWTDSPEEKLKKLQNPLKKEKKKKEEYLDIEQKKKQDNFLEQYNSERKSLVEEYTSNYLKDKKFEADEVKKRGFDREKDMTSFRLNPEKKQKMLNESKLLDSKFKKSYM
ncbi:hypothetical protein HDU92_008221 [Lobulomyces angularis]|nr:hypothetical protein HDU92_008221 [Lobulomyces angularis]